MTFTASNVKCLELNMDLDKIAASGQCFRWTPAPFPGGYIVPAGGYCATIYRLDGKIVVHEHTISHQNTLDPAAQAARAFWENYLDGAGFSARWVDLEYYLVREPESYIARAASAACGQR